MEVIKSKLAGPRLRAVLTILGWSLFNASAAIAGLLDGSLVPRKMYGGGGGFVISTLSSSSLMMPINVRVSEFQAELQTGQIFGTPVGMLVFYLEILGIAILAGLLLEELERVLVSFFACYALTVVLVYLFLILPGLAGSISLSALEGIGITFVFQIFFPIALFLGLVGGFIGAALFERLH